MRSQAISSTTTINRYCCAVKRTRISNSTTSCYSFNRCRNHCQTITQASASVVLVATRGMVAPMPALACCCSATATSIKWAYRWQRALNGSNNICYCCVVVRAAAKEVVVRSVVLQRPGSALWPAPICCYRQPIRHPPPHRPRPLPRRRPLRLSQQRQQLLRLLLPMHCLLGDDTGETISDGLRQNISAQ